MVEYVTLPENVMTILDSLYVECARINEDLKVIGWSCNYGLDDTVFDILKVN